jgi:ribosome-binding protein aMBF1 (putative translation factor)
MPSYRCDAPGCVRGVVHAGAFGEPCNVCGGRGSVSLAELARRLDEDEAIIKRLTTKRKMRPKTCQRLLDKLLAIVAPAPKKQSELFT